MNRSNPPTKGSGPRTAREIRMHFACGLAVFAAAFGACPSAVPLPPCWVPRELGGAWLLNGRFDRRAVPLALLIRSLPVSRGGAPRFSGVVRDCACSTDLLGPSGDKPPW